MCVSRREIKNPYTGRTMFVNCGVCPACQQQKANRRASKIRSFSPDGYVPYFVTLSYSNRYIPYIDISELEQQYQLLNRYNLHKHSLSVNVYRGPEKELLGDFDFDYNFFDFVSPISSLPPLRVRDYSKRTKYDYLDLCGVIYYKDIVNFFKRLRINLLRHYGLQKKIFYYSTSEYGPTSNRPHFHTIIWLPKGFPFEDLQRCICSSWTFCTWTDERKRKSIQVARDPSNYVASYVNYASTVHPFLLEPPFRPKCSHSKNFGFDDPAFSLDKILETFQQRGDTRYVREVVTKDAGVVSVVSSYPAYVVYRYFPKLPSEFRLSSNQICYALANPECVFKLCRKDRFLDDDKRFPTPFLDSCGEPVELSNRQKIAIFRRIVRCYERYWQPLGYSRHDFAYTVHRFRMRLFTDSLIGQFDDVISPIDSLYAYDNVLHVFNGTVSAPTITNLVDDSTDVDMYLDSNTFPAFVSLTHRLNEKFYEYMKQRKLNDV